MSDRNLRIERRLQEEIRSVYDTVERGLMSHGHLLNMQTSRVFGTRDFQRLPKYMQHGLYQYRQGVDAERTARWRNTRMMDFGYWFPKHGWVRSKDLSIFRKHVDFDALAQAGFFPNAMYWTGNGRVYHGGFDLPTTGTTMFAPPDAPLHHADLMEAIKDCPLWMALKPTDGGFYFRHRYIKWAGAPWEEPVFVQSRDRVSWTVGYRTNAQNWHYIPFTAVDTSEVWTCES